MILLKRENYLYKLKIISDKHVKDSSLELLLKKIDCKYMHVYRITEHKTGDYFGKTNLNFIIPDSIVNGGVESIIKYCDENTMIINIVLDLQECNTKYFILKQYYCGVERDDESLITSSYLWNKEIAEDLRQENMYQHFQLEKNQQLYNAIHFNSSLDIDWRNSKDLDFVFEGYLAGEESIKMIYEQPFIEKMRKHSEGFLDTSTRQLAFGKVKIMKR